MDFIEKLWGLSPDSGSGATELTIFAVPVLIILILAVRLYRAGAVRGNGSGA